MIRSINCGYGKPALPAESAKSSSSARIGFGFASMKIDLVRRREPQVDARVAIDRQQTVDAFARLLDLRDERRIKALGELILQAPAFAIFLVPLRAIGRDLRLVRRHLAEDQLADRKNGQPQVAHQADVEFAALDVFLGDHVAVVFLVNESDALPELLVGLDEGGLRDAVGRLFFHRLDQDRELELPWPRDALAARDDHEVRARGCDDS